GLGPPAPLAPALDPGGARPGRAQRRLAGAQLDGGGRGAPRLAHGFGQLLVERGRPPLALGGVEVVAREHAAPLELDRDDVLLLAEERRRQLRAELLAAQLAHELEALLDVGVVEVRAGEQLPRGLAIREVAIEQRLGLARRVGRQAPADLGDDAGANDLVGLLAGRGEEVVEERERLGAGDEAAVLEPQVAVDLGAGERGRQRPQRRLPGGDAPARRRRRRDGGGGGRGRRGRRGGTLARADARHAGRDGERRQRARRERCAPRPHSPAFFSRLAWLRKIVFGLLSKIETSPRIWFTSS